MGESPRRPMPVDLHRPKAVRLHAQMDLDCRQVLADPEGIGSWRIEILRGYRKALADSARLRGQADDQYSLAQRSAIARELRTRILLGQCERALGVDLSEW